MQKDACCYDYLQPRTHNESPNKEWQKTWIRIPVAGHLYTQPVGWDLYDADNTDVPVGKSWYGESSEGVAWEIARVCNPSVPSRICVPDRGIHFLTCQNILQPPHSHDDVREWHGCQEVRPAPWRWLPPETGCHDDEPPGATEPSLPMSQKHHYWCQNHSFEPE